MANDNRGFASMDPQKQEEIAKKGGEASAASQDMSALGSKGGQATQQSGGNAHELTNEERSQGGMSQGAQNNPGNFANRPQEEVEEAAREGGSK
jgi:uncharacterized protein